MSPREVAESTQQKVLRTYCDNMESLSKAKQFHFNSRLFLWTQEPYYEKRLISLKDFFLENIEEVIENVKTPLQNTRKDSYIKDNSRSKNTLGSPNTMHYSSSGYF